MEVNEIRNLATELGMAMNNCSSKDAELLMAFMNEWHPTVSQAFMRNFIVPNIKRLAGKNENDPRIKATVKLCRVLAEDIGETHLPCL